MSTAVDHPTHYTDHPSGIECITITEGFNFNVGNAIKYLWRAGKKSGRTYDEDLAKAIWYIKRERERAALERRRCRPGQVILSDDPRFPQR